MAQIKGLVLAQASLGYMYQRGFGVSQDHGEAVRWYREAIQQGLAMSRNEALALAQNRGLAVALKKGLARRLGKLFGKERSFVARHYPEVGVVKDI